MSGFSDAGEYQSEVHRGLLDEISAGIAYDHACGMIAIEIGKRLLPSSVEVPLLAIVRSTDEDKPKLLPKIYGGKDEFGFHMVVNHEGLIYDPLSSEPLANDQYGQSVFLNTSINILTLSEEASLNQFNRSEPTMYENGLLATT